MIQPQNHLRIVTQTGAFPLSASEIQQINRDWYGWQAWQATLQYIPFLQPVPQVEQWYITEKVIADVGWQIIQYGFGQDAIPGLLLEAETYVNTWK